MVVNILPFMGIQTILMSVWRKNIVGFTLTKKRSREIFHITKHLIQIIFGLLVLGGLILHHLSLFIRSILLVELNFHFGIARRQVGMEQWRLGCITSNFGRR